MKPPQRSDFSTTVTVGDKTFAFPTLMDYVNTLKEQGEIAEEGDILENQPELIIEIQRHWISTLQVGCVFASKLAGLDESDSWRDILVTGVDLESPSTVQLIVEQVAKECVDQEAFQIIFPTVRTAEDVAKLCVLFSEQAGWALVDLSDEFEDKSKLPVGLRWRLPGDPYASWVLGFANISSMPVTRRSPYTSLVLRSKPPESTDISRQFDETMGVESVHLADLPMDVSPKTFSKYWTQTSVRKQELLSSDSSAAFAKAKTTFTLPLKFKNELAEKFES